MAPPRYNIYSMTTRFANETEIATWNERILANPDGGNVFQGWEFAQQKRLTGWQPRYILADDIAVTVHEKAVPGLGKLWYLPKGPGVTDIEQLTTTLAHLRTFAATCGVFALKLEPELPLTNTTLAQLTNLHLQQVSPIQPNFSTVTVDLTPPLEEVLAGLHQKGRHAIKRAQRDGVTIRRVEATEAHCRTFYDLLAATAEGSFRIRNYDYYKSFWQRYADAGLGQLFFADYDGQVVAGAFAISFGAKSTYKDGASIRERTAYGASHLLQWDVMCWAKEKGSLLHDLCGAPPSARIKDETHPHYGIGRFKTSFNKDVTDYVGAWDLPIRRLRYLLWRRVGERLTLRLHAQRHHESWY